MYLETKKSLNKACEELKGRKRYITALLRDYNKKAEYALKLKKNLDGIAVENDFGLSGENKKGLWS